VRDYWTPTHYKQEEGYRFNATYSRISLKYPEVLSRFTLPDTSDLYNVHFYWCGVELGGRTDWGYASFVEHENNDVIISINAQGVGLLKNTVTSLLPSDYLSADHMYSVKVNAGFVEFRVDGELVAVYVQGETGQYLYAGEPYVVRVAPFSLPAAMPALVELSVEDPAGTYPEYTVGFNAQWYRWSSGSPAPPRTYRLYDEGASTLMTSGTYDSGTSHKSHPVPTRGYSNKTLLFQADTDSASAGLTIEVLTQEGNWRTYDSLTYSGGSLESYTISGNFPLARIGYEPSVDGASVTDAEVHLG